MHAVMCSPHFQAPDNVTIFERRKSLEKTNMTVEFAEIQIVHLRHEGSII